VSHASAYLIYNQVQVLDLRENNVGDEGARSLLSCVHLIEKLYLKNCNISDSTQEELKSELRRKGLPVSNFAICTHMFNQF